MGTAVPDEETGRCGHDIASFWNHTEDSETISIQHFKGRMQQIFEAYRNLISQTQYMLQENTSDLLDDIYTTYLRTGYLMSTDQPKIYCATRHFSPYML